MRKFIQLWKDEKLDPFDDVLVRWLLLLGMVDARKQRVYDDIYKELEELAMKDERLMEAFNAWEELSQTPDSIIAYESRLKTIIDEEAKIDYANHKGIEEGMEKGKKKEKKETILKGAEKGLDVETLAEITSLSVEEVEAISRSVPGTDTT